MHCAKCFFYDGDVGDEVCNRCGRAYLPEANVYLGLIVLVTGGVAWVLRHVLTVAIDPFVRPAAELGLWVTWPVSIVEVPAWGLVMGGWLAMLAVAPLVAGMLYGKRGGWLVSLVIAAVGPSAALALAAALGVWIAAGYTTRLSSKLASALLGLIPSAAYWFVATATTDFAASEPAAATASVAPALAIEPLPPALRGLIYAPPLVAMIVATAAASVVVAIGWADRWHVRWPGVLVTVLTAGPVLAMLALVGIDEVRYGMFLRATGAAAPTVAEERSELDRLQEFLARHGSSPRAPEVRARLAERIETIEAGLRPGPASRPSKDLWQEIVRTAPRSPWAVDARLRLGDEAARHGLFDQAEQFYRDALRQSRSAAAPPPDPLEKFSPLWDYFTVGRDLRARDDAEHLQRNRQESLERLTLLLENRRSSPESSAALGLYFTALWYRGTNQFRPRLEQARDADPKGPLADNVAYELVMLALEAGPKRVEELTRLAQAFPGTDGAMLARQKAARDLLSAAEHDATALRRAQGLLIEVQRDLAARKAACPEDPYVALLASDIEKELVYVQAQLQAPPDS